MKCKWAFICLCFLSGSVDVYSAVQRIVFLAYYIWHTVYWNTLNHYLAYYDSMIVWIMELAPVCTCTSPLYSVCYPCCLLLTCSPVVTFRVLLTVLTAVSSKCTCHPVCKDVLKSQNQKPISSTNQVLIFQRYSHFIVKFSWAAVKGQKQNDLMWYWKEFDFWSWSFQLPQYFNWFLSHRVHPLKLRYLQDPLSISDSILYEVWIWWLLLVSRREFNNIKSNLKIRMF